MPYRTRYWLEDRLILVLWCSPGVLLLIWDFVSPHETAKFLLNWYVLISTPFFVLNGSYPPFGSRWFWKAMIPILLMVGIAFYGYLQLASLVKYLNLGLPARMTWGFVATVAMLESVCALRIVDATEPRTNRKQ